MDVRQKIVEIDKVNESERITYNTVNEKISLGSVPIMVRSDFCILKDKSNEDR